MNHWPKPVYCIACAYSVSPHTQQTCDLKGDPISQDLVLRNTKWYQTKRCWSGNNSQPWVNLETRVIRLACFLFCMVKVILDLRFMGKSWKLHVCLWGSSEHGAVQKVPTNFVQQGTKPSHFYFPLHDVTTIQPQLGDRSRNYLAYFWRYISGINLPYCFVGRVCSLWEGTLEREE